MALELQETLKPVLALISDPLQITFEDEIVLFCKAFVTKTKQVSPIMWECFDQFPLVVIKNKGQMNEMMDTMSAYMKYGGTDFAQREQSIRAYA